MPLPSFVIEAFAVAVLLSLVGLRWRYERRCWARFLAEQETSCARKLEGSMPLSTRANRATAIALAAMSFRGETIDVERLLSLADEFLQYIEGDDAAPIPRPDKATRGRMPKP